VDGEALTFGNQGGLYMNAMTWWDHKTSSLWSQPWGTAISGPLEGTALTLIPGSIVPWATWLEGHPDTTLVSNDLDRTGFGPTKGHDNFVIGVALEESATAYPYRLASEERVINDRVGEHPIVVFVDPGSRDIAVYLRKLGAAESEGLASAELVFEMDDLGRVVDGETGTIWLPSRGTATEGPLKGTTLLRIPYVSSFDWAWSDFFPHSTFYGQ
jgi:hypothetical protein